MIFLKKYHSSIFYSLLNNKFLQNLKVTDSNDEVLSVDEQVLVKQISKYTATTDSKCVRTLRSQRKRIAFDTEDKNLEIGVGYPKFPKAIKINFNDTEEELEENQGSRTQWSTNEKVISGRISSSKICLEKDESLVRLSEKKVGNFLEMLKIKTAELKVIENNQKIGNCNRSPLLQKQSLRPSESRKQVRIDSSSSENSQELKIDTDESMSAQGDQRTGVVLAQCENMNMKSDEAEGNQILTDGNTAVHEFSEKETWKYLASCGKLIERMSSEDNTENSKKYEISNTANSENQVAVWKRSNTSSPTVRIKPEKTLKYRLEDAETVAGSLKNVRERKFDEKDLICKNRQTGEEKKQKLIEEVSNVESEWEGIGQTTASLQKSKMVGIHQGMKPVVCYYFMNVTL